MIYLILLLYAFVHGKTNAFLYSRKGSEALPRNEHIDLTLERWLVGAGILAACLWPWPLVAVEIVAGALAFSFWHNGAYYHMREQIRNPAVYDWDEDFWHWWTYLSPTSTAEYSLSWHQRLWLKIASLVLLVIAYTLYFVL